MAIRDGMLGLAYPEQCRICGAPVESWDEGIVCAQCWDDPSVTRLLNILLCEKCGASMGRRNSDYQPSAKDANPRFCGKCVSVPFSAARASGLYCGAIEASVLSLKVTPHI